MTFKIHVFPIEYLVAFDAQAVRKREITKWHLNIKVCPTFPLLCADIQNELYQTSVNNFARFGSMVFFEQAD